MRFLIIIIFTSIGSWVGWWLGYHWGLFSALVMGMLGTGAGIYFGRRFNQVLE
jgi:hypothetical protein